MTYELQDTIAIFSLDDGKVNAVGNVLIDSINDWLDQAQADDAAAIVMLGREGMFSAGFDLGEFKKGPEQGIAMVKKGLQLALRLYSLPVPLVAACTGHAIAMGAFLLLCCDTRIGARGDYKITLPETAISMDIPTPLMTLTLHRLAPRFITRATVQSEVFTPDQSMEAGFLDEVVAEHEVHARALAVARALARLPRTNYGNNKLLARENVLAEMQAELEKLLQGS